MPSVVERLRDRLAPATSNGGDAAARPAWAASCLNCGQELAGAFCSRCGQRAVPPHPRLGELAGDAFAELSGWDGKFVDTFRLLLTKPGALTRRFIDGQRVRYIAPVRLYLTLSLLYFFAAAAAPTLVRPGSNVNLGPVHIGVTSSDPNSGPAQAARAAQEAQSNTLSPEERKSALAQVSKAPRLLRPILQRAIDDPQGLKRGMYESMPKLFFVLLPAFAGFLALFYRRRHFPEHLYFSIHLHAYAFLVLGIAALSSFTHVFGVQLAFAVVAQISVPIYTFLALRRVYGGSVLGTLGKELGVGVLYLFAYGASMLGLVYWAAVNN